jgi:hypothetical protein
MIQEPLVREMRMGKLVAILSCVLIESSNIMMFNDSSLALSTIPGSENEFDLSPAVAMRL